MDGLTFNYNGFDSFTVLYKDDVNQYRADCRFSENGNGCIVSVPSEKDANVMTPIIASMPNGDLINYIRTSKAQSDFYR